MDDVLWEAASTCHGASKWLYPISERARTPHLIAAHITKHTCHANTQTMEVWIIRWMSLKHWCSVKKSYGSSEIVIGKQTQRKIYRRGRKSDIEDGGRRWGAGFYGHMNMEILTTTMSPINLALFWGSARVHMEGALGLSTHSLSRIMTFSWKCWFQEFASCSGCRQ